MFGQSYINVFGSTHQHPRFYLRLLAIATAVTGLVLSCFTLGASLRGRYMHRARILTGVAIIPLGISIGWHLFDLFRSRGADNRRSPLAALAVVLDGAGFFAFLTLMIANGFLVKDLANEGSRVYGLAIMLTYNQFPWIVCSAIHAILVIQQLPLVGGPRVCEHCQREMGQSVSPKGGMTSDCAPLLEHRDSYQDEVEPNVIAAGPNRTHNESA